MAFYSQNVFFAIFLICFGLGRSLEWVRFSVPETAVEGEDVLLTCEFDVQGERLYSVKWYKSGREFYRYVPGEWPPQQAFSQQGVRVDVSRSDDQRVTLHRVEAASGGRYKCEVLTEAPLFKTLVKSQPMNVVELPDGKPNVVGGEVEYRPGDTVHLNCSAPKSRPPATLTWYINEQEAPSDYLIEYSSQTDENGRAAPLLGLKFTGSQWHFHNGELRLRCSARLSRFYAADAMHNALAIATFSEANVADNVSYSSAAASGPSIVLAPLFALIEVLIACFVKRR